MRSCWRPDAGTLNSHSKKMMNECVHLTESSAKPCFQERVESSTILVTSMGQLGPVKRKECSAPGQSKDLKN